MRKRWTSPPGPPWFGVSDQDDTRRPWSGLSFFDTVLALGFLVFAFSLFVPGWRRGRLQEAAHEIRLDLAAIGRATSAAQEADRLAEGTPIEFDLYRRYLVDRERLKKTGQDPLGHAYGPQFPGEPPLVPTASWERLQGVVPDDFWPEGSLP